MKQIETTIYDSFNIYIRHAILNKFIASSEIKLQWPDDSDA